jgi:hypothetical protein
MSEERYSPIFCRLLRKKGDISLKHLCWKSERDSDLFEQKRSFIGLRFNKKIEAA